MKHTKYNYYLICVFNPWLTQFHAVLKQVKGKKERGREREGEAERRSEREREEVRERGKERERENKEDPARAKAVSLSSHRFGDIGAVA